MLKMANKKIKCDGMIKELLEVNWLKNNSSGTFNSFYSQFDKERLASLS